MSSSSFARRAARALAVAVVLLLGAGAPAASAATVFVDDDHAQCPAAGFRAISPALARVPAGSTIFVCPGTYVEQLQMMTPGVSVVGLTGDPARVVLRPPDPLTSASAMVEMSAPATRLSGITLQGPAPASFGCGPFFGVFIGVLVHNGAGPFSGASVIAHVRLRQIGLSGCPEFLNHGPVGVQIGAPAGGAMSGRATVRNSSYMGDQSAIAVNRDSRADIRDNVLGHPFRRGPRLSQPFGIRAVGSVVNIARNEISGFELLRDENGQLGFGIQLVGVSGTVGGGPGAGNIVRDNATGVWLLSTSGVTVSHNLVLRSFFEGILADGLSTGNLFLNNVSKSNGGRDCVDQSGANRWSGNIGSQPVSPGQKAICPLPRR